MMRKWKRTLIECSKKNHIMSRCFIGRTAADHRGCQSVVLMLDVTECCFTETLCHAGRTVLPEEDVAAGHVPARRIRPLFLLIVTTSILPY